MDFFSGADGTSGAAPCGLCRSGVDNAAGLTDFSRAWLVALFSIAISLDRPSGAMSAARLLPILVLLRTGGDARQCITRVMPGRLLKNLGFLGETWQAASLPGKSDLSYFELVISRTTSCMRAR